MELEVVEKNLMFQKTHTLSHTYSVVGIVKGRSHHSRSSQHKKDTKWHNSYWVGSLKQILNVLFTCSLKGCIRVKKGCKIANLKELILITNSYSYFPIFYDQRSHTMSYNSPNDRQGQNVSTDTPLVHDKQFGCNSLTKSGIFTKC